VTPGIDDRTLLRAPAFTVDRLGGGRVLALDPAAPNWIVTDERGLEILWRLDGRTPLAEVAKSYAAATGADLPHAWLHVDTLVRDALRQRFVSTDGAVPLPYLGRAAYLETDRLRELWIQINDFCNLACGHCLVSSGPDREQGLPTDRLLDVIDQAAALGAERIFLTGGEPLARPDVLELVRRAAVHHARQVVILTNGTLLKGERLAALAALPVDRVRVQVSLDGSRPEINDPIRGRGSFNRIVEGVKRSIGAGLDPTLTATILRHNLGDLDDIVRLAASLRVRTVHLLWPHRRGRVLTGPFGDLPSAAEILEAVRGARTTARALGVSVDNLEEFRLRLDGAPGVKNDLAGAGWNSLCVYTDGRVYPSASMAGVPDLRLGDLASASLEQIWKESPVARSLREATVERKPTCRSCTLKFLCGGGDVEHGYWAGGSFASHDPYCDLYKGLAADAFAELAAEGRETVQPRSGFDRPVVLRGMGERLLHDEGDAVVRTTHSACVLSEEVMERSRLGVRAFYGEAAEHPQPELCCPVRPDESDLAHIPPEVIERFYGCGSPVTAAALAPGETFVDLGSGAGIDPFIAAKYVGREGRVYGIDMTERMLAVARDCQPRVADALGYDVVEFRQGYLEALPLDDGIADVVTSNCVINLSPDKRRVFREIWRVLKDHGRAVIADIVADREVPPRMRADGRLWGECISGALTEDALLAELERAGFHGAGVLKKSFWREVEGCRFYSVTVRGYKFEKKAGCTYIGQYAVYLGPMKATIDEEGHFFPRGVPVEVCTDTAARLARPPYAGAFLVVEHPDGRQQFEGGADAGCCAPGSGCC
jgi:7,8-dihydro-6-hydroxymethylpterin dimethyltransferase